MERGASVRASGAVSVRRARIWRPVYVMLRQVAVMTRVHVLSRCRVCECRLHSTVLFIVIASWCLAVVPSPGRIWPQRLGDKPHHQTPGRDGDGAGLQPQTVGQHQVLRAQLVQHHIAQGLLGQHRPIRSQ